jgi:hypothetical protein
MTCWTDTWTYCIGCFQPNDPPVTQVKDEPPVIAEHEDGAQLERPLPELVAVATDALPIATMAEEAVANDALAEGAETETRVVDPTWVECACVEANRVPVEQSLPPTAEAVEDQPPQSGRSRPSKAKTDLHQENSFGLDERSQRRQSVTLRLRKLPTKRTQ